MLIAWPDAPASMNAKTAYCCAKVRDRSGRLCCLETVRAALHRLGLSWKTTRKLLGRANRKRRKAFIATLNPLLQWAETVGRSGCLLKVRIILTKRL